jgi:hypothetical protein
MSEPMRVVIIPSDTFCSVDGVGFHGVEMSSVSADVHAVQWYGTHGEVEIQNPQTGRMVRNDEINSLAEYSAVFDSYWEIRSSEEAAQQAIIDEQTVIEV